MSDEPWESISNDASRDSDISDISDSAPQNHPRRREHAYRPREVVEYDTSSDEEEGDREHERGSVSSSPMPPSRRQYLDRENATASYHPRELDAPDDLSESDSIYTIRVEEYLTDSEEQEEWCAARKRTQRRRPRRFRTASLCNDRSESLVRAYDHGRDRSLENMTANLALESVLEQGRNREDVESPPSRREIERDRESGYEHDHGDRDRDSSSSPSPL